MQNDDSVDPGYGKLTLTFFGPRKPIKHIVCCWVLLGACLGSRNLRLASVIENHTRLTDAWEAQRLCRDTKYKSRRLPAMVRRDIRTISKNGTRKIISSVCDIRAFTTANLTPRKFLGKKVFWIYNTTSTSYFNEMQEGIEPILSWTSLIEISSLIRTRSCDLSLPDHGYRSISASRHVLSLGITVMGQTNPPKQKNLEGLIVLQMVVKPTGISQTKQEKQGIFLSSESLTFCYALFTVYFASAHYGNFRCHYHGYASGVKPRELIKPCFQRNGEYIFEPWDRTPGNQKFFSEE